MSPGPAETQMRRKRGISKERAADKDAATDIYFERKEGRWTGGERGREGGRKRGRDRDRDFIRSKRP